MGTLCMHLSRVYVTKLERRPNLYLLHDQGSIQNLLRKILPLELPRGGAPQSNIGQASTSALEWPPLPFAGNHPTATSFLMWEMFLMWKMSFLMWNVVVSVISGTKMSVYFVPRASHGRESDVTLYGKGSRPELAAWNSLHKRQRCR
jgi:hypothetical protein